VKTRRTIRGSLRAKLLLAQLLAIGVGIATMAVAIVVSAPGIFDRLMTAMMGPNSSGMMNGMMAGMQQTVAAAFRSAMLQALLLGASAATFAAVAISLFVAWRIGTPVQRLLIATRRIADGHYAERVPPGEPDELGALAEQFNVMAGALESAERRRVALISDVAHELRTPLATIEGYTEGLLDGVVAPGAETWVLLHDEVGRLRRLVQDLQEVSRAEARQLPLHIAPSPPAQLVDQALAVIAPQYSEKKITLTTSVPADLAPVLADRDRIVQVLINLLGNALRYTPAGGTVAVQAERRASAAPV
jgi:two-component system, OmpR family, sensor histidine kinase BaeS